MKKLEPRDVVLVLILALLVVNTLHTFFPPRPATADTFRLDDCITTAPAEQPNAYLHVVTH